MCEWGTLFLCSVLGVYAGVGRDLLGSRSCQGRCTLYSGFTSTTYLPEDGGGADLEPNFERWGLRQGRDKACGSRLGTTKNQPTGRRQEKHYGSMGYAVWSLTDLCAGRAGPRSSEPG